MLVVYTFGGKLHVCYLMCTHELHLINYKSICPKLVITAISAETRLFSQMTNSGNYALGNINYVDRREGSASAKG